MTGRLRCIGYHSGRSSFKLACKMVESAMLLMSRRLGVFGQDLSVKRGEWSKIFYCPQSVCVG